MASLSEVFHNCNAVHIKQHNSICVSGTVYGKRMVQINSVQSSVWIKSTVMGLFCSRVDAKQAGTSSGTAHLVTKIEDPAKNSKRITDWIKSISDLQKVRLPTQACFTFCQVICTTQSRTMSISVPK